MKRRIARTATVALCTIAALAGQARACDRGTIDWHAHAGLSLTEEEKAAVTALHGELAKYRVEQNKQADALKVKIHDELKKEKPDQAVLATLAAQQGDIRKNISLKRIALLEKLKAVVTGDKYAKLLEADWGCACEMGAGAAKKPEEMKAEKPVKVEKKVKAEKKAEVKKAE